MNTLSGACAMVTGGTGSFGQTLVHHLLEVQASEVRVFSRDEAKQDAMRRKLADARARFYLGDVRDFQSVDDAMRGVDLVFHAAALKQVPSCEFFPQQAIATNIQGTEHVLRSAAAHGVSAVVCLSTDKAVYPINAMGMSKALMEKVVKAYARNNPDSRTIVSCVRYGNVMASRGSVIPLFIEQIREGTPLTLTNPEMTRFLMSLEESVELVDYALSNANPGDLFVKKAPACTVGDLAVAINTVMSANAEIRVMGDRHGEKLHETLLSAEEMRSAEDRGAYFRVPLDDRSLDYALYFDDGWNASQTVEAYSSNITRRLSIAEVVSLLEELPEIQLPLGKRIS